MGNWILNLFGFVYVIISELQAPKVGRLFTPELYFSCFGVQNTEYRYNLITHHMTHTIYILPGLKFIPIGPSLKESFLD